VEIALGWRGSTENECSLCGCDRSLYEDEAYFELQDGGGYWTCRACYDKELETARHLLYTRGCRWVILTSREKGSRTILRVLSEAPWTERTRGSSVKSIRNLRAAGP